jgi:hypothetical protein
VEKKSSHPALNQQLLPTCQHKLNNLHCIHPHLHTPGCASQAHCGTGSTANAQLFAMPYLEHRLHSLFYKLTCFVLSINWTCIIVTVNVESTKSHTGDNNMSWASSTLHYIVHWSIGFFKGMVHTAHTATQTQVEAIIPQHPPTAQCKCCHLQLLSCVSTGPHSAHPGTPNP